MKNVRCGVMVLLFFLWSVPSAPAGVSISIGIPNLSIGINIPVYPELVPVPGYPVYYAPGVNGNYFFYDGMYWVFQSDNWYASSWYNGPWALVDPIAVPPYILRVPVRYYRQPPPYFRGWQRGAPPHWGEHWGQGWEQSRRGWNSRAGGPPPAAAPLPAYQRQYSRDRYPKTEQQYQLHNQQYRYQPREPVVQQHYQQHYQQHQQQPQQYQQHQQQPQQYQQHQQQQGRPGGPPPGQQQEHH